MIRGERFRFWGPVAFLVALGIYSVTRLVIAHIAPQANAPNYMFRRKLLGRRGSIYSSVGKDYPLVRSVPYWEYHLDPVDLTNGVIKRKGEPVRPRLAIVKTIADTLKLDYRRVKHMAEMTNRRYQFLSVSADTKAHDTLVYSNLVRGVVIEDKQVRDYLGRRHLSHVLGSVNAEFVGSAGIEQRFDHELAGTPGTIIGMHDAKGRELYDKRKISIEPISGADVFLTVDHNLQFEAEDALKWGVTEYGAGSGWCIVMDSRTGAVLAMASLPDFDPVNYGHTSDSAKLNRAIAFNYEPGSIMKVITAASAFDAGFASPSTVYRTNRDDPRYFKLPGDGSHVWEPTMTIREAIVHSSNIVIGKLGYDFGAIRLWSYMRKFGFGEKTGIELPGEQFGILKNPRKQMWDKASQSRAGIGQFVAVTAIQIASAYQAIANDGVRMHPHIVDRVVGADGREIYHYNDQPASRPISARAARTIREVMLDVASPKGTARRAAIRGYSVAGKTGTAQKAIPGGRGYYPGLYRASFCGIVPATEPRLVILVTLDFDQKTLYHQGGNSSGPVFRRIAMGALRYLCVPPDRPEELEEFTDDDDFDKVMDDRSKKYGIILDN